MSPPVRRYDLPALRAREFPWAARGERIYLDHAAIGPHPASTRRALESYAPRRAEPWRLSGDDFAPVLAAARTDAERLIGAPPGSVALATNTSQGLNLAAFGLGLTTGDVILTTEGEFPANLFPWQAVAARTGAVVRRVPTVDRFPDEPALAAALDDPRVRVLALSWVSYVTGHRFTLGDWGRRCRERGIVFVVDGIQGAGTAPVDVVADQVDVFACGAQKWLLSPWGTGFTYVRPALMERLQPVTAGWLAAKGTDDFAHLLSVDLSWHDDARRYELFTLPMHDLVGMSASFRMLLGLGLDAIEAHLHALGDHAVAFAQATPGIRLVTPAQRAHRAGLLAFEVADPTAASHRLREGGVDHTVREGLVRLSPHCYNTADELDAALMRLVGA